MHRNQVLLKMILPRVSMDTSQIDVLEEACSRSRFGFGLWACRMLREEEVQSSGNVCCICLDEIKHENLTTSCKHTFHKRCLLQCVDERCPMCRTDLYCAGEDDDDVLLRSL